MRMFAIVAISAVLSSCPLYCFAQAKPNQAKPSTAEAEKSETPHLAFVTEYIRELSEIENIHASAEKELSEDKESSVFATSIHASTLFQLELGSQIGMLSSMHMDKPFEQLIPTIRTFYQRKIALWQRMTNISGTILEGPRPGVDYGKLAAEAPKIRAQLDYIDQALFEATPLVFATLIDSRADSKNHANHLIITKVDRAKLIADLNASFGSRLDKPNQPYGVSTAKVLKAYLLKDFKCSDEPWE